MRNVALPFLAWAGVLQSISPPGSTIDSAIRLVGLASVLGTLTVLVYRLGVWRQEMEHAKHNVGVQLQSHRSESSASFGRLERRLDSIERRLERLERNEYTDYTDDIDVEWDE